ncbi:MAG: hypothetical protein ABI186_02000 [Candidatus Elarobacter sp.]
MTSPPAGSAAISSIVDTGGIGTVARGVPSAANTRISESPPSMSRVAKPPPGSATMSSITRSPAATSSFPVSIVWPGPMPTIAPREARPLAITASTSPTNAAPASALLPIPAAGVATCSNVAAAPRRM